MCTAVGPPARGPPLSGVLFICLFWPFTFRSVQVMVNLEPTDPALGTAKLPLKSMHNAQGCECHGKDHNGVSDIRINHYLGSIGDYMDRTVRYWEVGRSLFARRPCTRAGFSCALACVFFHVCIPLCIMPLRLQVTALAESRPTSACFCIRACLLPRPSSVLLFLR